MPTAKMSCLTAFCLVLGFAGLIRADAPEPDATLAEMRAVQQKLGWRELADQYASHDFAGWPAESRGLAVEALRLRGQAYAFTQRGPEADADYRKALELAPNDPAAWIGLADNLTNNLKDDEKALAAFRKVLELVPNLGGWMPISATLSIARILTDQVKPDEALETLQGYRDQEGIAPVWKIKVVRACGHAYAARGAEKESLAKFREALELEKAASAGK